jgi:hypothetical protein
MMPPPVRPCGTRPRRRTIRPDPFLHIVIPDALDPDFYAALADSFPGFARIGWDDPTRRVPSNRRFLMGADMIRFRVFDTLRA